MAPKKPHTSSKPQNQKKKGGKSSLSLPSEQSEDPRPTQNDTESGYDTAVTTISTFTRTSRNSSAPIVIPREADGSYGDPTKIEATAKRAVRVAKQAREAEARIATTILEPESTDEPSIRPEEDSQTLDELESRLVARTPFIAPSNSDLNSL